MAAKVPGALRLLPEKWARVDAYAKSRGVSRQRVLESAVDSFLDDAVRGVPEITPPEVVEKMQQSAVPAPTRDVMRERHMKLARELGWSA